MNIIITGASSGIGFELSKLFLSNKENNVIVIARNKAKLDKLTEFSKGNLYIISEDINNIKSLPDAIENIECVDILINNAGYLIHKEYSDFDDKEIQEIFNTNFFAPAKLISLIIPKLSKSDHKHVVNISSMGGYQGSAKFAGLSYYSASKGALGTLTECLAEEYKDVGISFNALALGAVQTEMLTRAFPEYKAPLQADAMADMIYDFALNGNKYFNGKIIPVSLSTP